VQGLFASAWLDWLVREYNGSPAKIIKKYELLFVSAGQNDEWESWVNRVLAGVGEESIKSLGGVYDF